jgi:predicted kinase
MYKILKHSCVVLQGVTQSGKSTWARNNFEPHEIVSVSDLRCELTGDAHNYTQDRTVWQELYRRAYLRLQMGQRAVIDSTNLKREDIRHWNHVCDELGLPLCVVQVKAPLDVLQARAHQAGTPVQVLERQLEQLAQTERSMRHADRMLKHWISPEQAHVVPLHAELSHRLLVVGDVHGNLPGMQHMIQHAEAELRQIVWLGDVVDYGSQNLACVRAAHTTVSQGVAHMIWGNHERKIDRWIHSDWGERYQGRLSDANWSTVREILSLTPDRRARFSAVWKALSNWSTQHVVCGTWMMTHGAAHPQMWHCKAHRLPGDQGNLAFFGEVSSQEPNRADGYPNRTWGWVDQVPPGHTVVVGHDYLDRVNHAPVIKLGAQGGRVICVDTGSSKGGVLSAVEVDVDTNNYRVIQYDPTHVG